MVDKITSHVDIIYLACLETEICKIVCYKDLKRTKLLYAIQYLLSWFKLFWNYCANNYNEDWISSQFYFIRSLKIPVNSLSSLYSSLPLGCMWYASVVKLRQFYPESASFSLSKVTALSSCNDMKILEKSSLTSKIILYTKKNERKKFFWLFFYVFLNRFLSNFKPCIQYTRKTPPSLFNFHFYYVY